MALLHLYTLCLQLKVALLYCNQMIACNTIFWLKQLKVANIATINCTSVAFWLQIFAVYCLKNLGSKNILGAQCWLIQGANCIKKIKNFRVPKFWVISAHLLRVPNVPKITRFKNIETQNNSEYTVPIYFRVLILRFKVLLGTQCPFIKGIKNF